MSESVVDPRLLRRISGAGTGSRLVVGVTGPPGAGKSTYALALVAALDDAAYLPMDGFHLADAQLERLGLRDRKGAPETFDVDGYAATLARVRAADRDVFVPGFERSLEQPLAAALVVPASARVVVTEGNYLLHDDGGWSQVAPLLDLSVYVDVPDDVRRSRLVDRHVQFGKTRPEAEAWVRKVDEPNGRLVLPGRSRADVVVPLPPETAQH